MQSALEVSSIPVGRMGQHGIPLDRFYGRPINVVTWGDERRLHSEHDCRAPAGVSRGKPHRVRFGADIASRMCGCCRVEGSAADDGPADAIFDLMSLCEVLDEEADEVNSREESGYTPDFLRPNFASHDHWRTLQSMLSVTTHGLQAHPWLLSWARPSLSRAAAHTERRCEEARALTDTAALDRAAVALQQSEQPTAQLAQAWQAWRQRQDSYDNASPDYAQYDRNTRLLPLSPQSAGSSAATMELSVRLPSLGHDWDGRPMVETLSVWEIAAIAAYKTTADWAGSLITLVAPPAVAQELLNPARGLDVTLLPPGTGRAPQLLAAP
ncbi:MULTISPECIES: hypothetical protein [Streptomyces]|uniref:hypothetical protein n=1 Tax=Streptomyces TaxID=1883 RepID=UPI0033B13848